MPEIESLEVMRVVVWFLIAAATTLGGAVVFFLSRIYSQFVKVVERVGAIEAKLTIMNAETNFFRKHGGNGHHHDGDDANY